MGGSFLSGLAKTAGIAGVALGVVYLVFRDFVPQVTGLNPQQWFTIATLLIFLTFGIAAIAMIVHLASMPDTSGAWIKIVVVAVVTLTIFALLLFYLPRPDPVPPPPPPPVCDGMPGQTAWIYAGNFDLSKKRALSETGIVADGNVKLWTITSNTWITLQATKTTAIMDYSKTGLARAMDSPFLRNGKIEYTCKQFQPGQRLYVADVELNGPSLQDQHLWLRVRLGLPGS